MKQCAACSIGKQESTIIKILSYQPYFYNKLQNKICILKVISAMRLKTILTEVPVDQEKTLVGYQINIDGYTTKRY